MTSDCSADQPLQPQAPLPATFEAALAELETLVQGMERPGLPLEALLQGYQRGMALSQFCQGKLRHAQAEVERLSVAPQAVGDAPEVGGA